MSLKTRLLKVERVWYSLKADYYSRSWQELYDHDNDALTKSEEFDNLIETANPPYWFWPGKEEWQREFGWVMTNKKEGTALFDEMLYRLKKFVDRQAQRPNDEGVPKL